MSTPETTVVGGDGEPLRLALPLTDCWAAVKRRRWFIARLACAGTAVAAAIAFLLPVEFESSAALMPPEQQALSTTSMLNALNGQLPSLSAGGGLLNQRTAGATSIGILESRTIQDEIVNRFDLRNVYGKKLLVDARLKLAKRTFLEEDRKNGLIHIVVMDHDRYRARDIARAYIENLNQLLNAVSTSSARREREFLETRVVDVRKSLDKSTLALGQFSSRNATLDPQKQAVSTLEIAGKLQTDLAAAEAELASLRTVYTDRNVQVRTVSARVEKLVEQLQKVTGQGETADSSDLTANNAFPSIRKLPMLGAEYGDQSRQVAVEEILYATLEKQYELARVEEAKEIPAVKILDEPEVPEKRSAPHRAVIIVAGLVLSSVLGTLWVVYQFLSQNHLRFAVRRKPTPSANEGC